MAMIVDTVGQKQRYIKPLAGGNEGNIQSGSPITWQHDMVHFAGKSSDVRFGGWWLTRTLQAATLLVASLATVGTDNQVKGEVSPESAKVMAWAKKPLEAPGGKTKSWDQLKDHEWNNIIVGLRTTDDIGELDFHPLRMQILKEAATDPSIPARVVVEAIDSAGVLGNVLTADHIKVSKAYKDSSKTPDDIKKEISDTLKSYQDRVIVDYRDASLAKARTFVAFDQVETAKRTGTGHVVYDYRPQAKAARAKVAHADSYKQLETALLQPGIAPEKRDELFDLIRQTRVPLPKTQVWALNNIFGNEEMDKYADASLKSTALSLTPVLPSLQGWDHFASLNASRTTRLALLTKEAPLKEPAKGTLRLANVPTELRYPQLPKTEAAQELFLAKNIEYLAQQNNPLALNAATQWLTRLEPAYNPAFFSPSGSISWKGDLFKEADIIVLKSLAQMAKQDGQARDVLYGVMASQPVLTYHVLYRAENNYQTYTPDVEAGLAIGQVFAADNKRAVQFAKDLVEGKATLLWAEPRDAAERQKLDLVRRDGKLMGFACMMLNGRAGFEPQLRRLAFDETDPLNRFAMTALGLVQDKTSIEPLMGIAANPLEDKSRRALAMETVLKITGPALVDTSIQERQAKEMPLSVGGLTLFRDVDSKTKQECFSPTVNPYQRIRDSRLSAWMENYRFLQGLVSESGRSLPDISEEQKTMQQQAIWQDMYAVGPNTVPLMVLAKKGDFQRQNLQPLVTQLQRQQLDPDAAVLAIHLLGRTQYKPSAELLTSIAKTPEKHVKWEGMSTSYSNKAAAIAAVRRAALENLGSVVDPTSADAKMIHRMLRDPYRPYQYAAIASLSGLGSQEMAPATRKDHVAEAMKTFKWLQNQHHSTMQNRNAREDFNVELAKAIYDLGGKDALVDYATELKATNKRHPLLRPIAHAMVNRGFEPKGNGADAQLVRFFTETGYWGLPKLHAKGITGQGVEALWFDAGHIVPVASDPALSRLVKYPEWTAWSVGSNWSEPHPTSTFKTFLQTAPGIDGVHSYHVNERRRPGAAASPVAELSFPASLEDALQNRMRPEGDPRRSKATVANYSIGRDNRILFEPAIRDLRDLIGAYMQAMGEVDIVSVVAAGNEQGDGPGSSFPAIGTVSHLGARIIDGKVVKNDSTITVSATDGLTGQLAEFSSNGDPLRGDEGIKMYAAPGYQELTYWYVDGRWQLVGARGTSFATPRAAGVVALEQGGRKKLGLPPLTHTQRNKALDETARPIPDREEWEGGRQLVPRRYLSVTLRVPIKPALIIPNGAKEDIIPIKAPVEVPIGIGFQPPWAFTGGNPLSMRLFDPMPRRREDPGE